MQAAQALPDMAWQIVDFNVLRSGCLICEATGNGAFEKYELGDNFPGRCPRRTFPCSTLFQRWPPIGAYEEKILAKEGKICSTSKPVGSFAGCG